MPAVFAWLLKVPALVWGPIRRHPLAAVLVLLLVGQQFQLWQGRRENTALRQTIEAQRTELAQARGAIVKLADAARQLKPGERVVEYLPKPQYIPYPVAGPPGPLRVEYIREPGRIETKVETITLPPKEIERVIREAPQSILVNLTAARDIKAGETFRVVVSQIQPGVWGGLLELGAPVTAEVTTVTPLERIPAPAPVASRLSVTLYSGYAFGSSPSWITGVRADYRLSPRWGLEADAAYFWATRATESRLIGTVRF